MLIVIICVILVIAIAATSKPKTAKQTSTRATKTYQPVKSQPTPRTSKDDDDGFGPDEEDDLEDEKEMREEEEEEWLKENPWWLEEVKEPENGLYPDDYLAALKTQQEEREAQSAHYKFVVMDFETTGLLENYDDILQVAIIDDKGSTLLNQLCKPVQVKAWPEAADINGIYPKNVAFCPTFEQISEYVQDILGRATKIIAYNTDFEKSFLKGHGVDPKQFKWAKDPMKTAAQYYNVQKGSNKRGVKLSVIAKMTGYTYTPHDALQDVQATRHVYLYLNDWTKRQRAEAAELKIKIKMSAKVSTVDTKTPPPGDSGGDA